jgi:hypothetical protein
VRSGLDHHGQVAVVTDESDDVTVEFDATSDRPLPPAAARAADDDESDLGRHRGGHAGTSVSSRQLAQTVRNGL